MPLSRACPKESSLLPTETWPSCSGSFAPSATTTIANRLPLSQRARSSRTTSSISIGCSGVSVTSAPPAMPAVIAIQPASLPITSTTCTRLCASVVECNRSTASVAIVTAVSKPKQTSVPLKSLSMVFGTPTQFTPRLDSSTEIDCVSSPPMAMSASSLWPSITSRQRSNPPSIFFTLVRDDRRIVPPRCSIPLVVSRSSGMVRSSITPRQPSRNPTNSSPYATRPCAPPPESQHSDRGSLRLRSTFQSAFHFLHFSQLEK